MLRRCVVVDFLATVFFAVAVACVPRVRCLEEREVFGSAIREAFFARDDVVVLTLREAPFGAAAFDADALTFCCAVFVVARFTADFARVVVAAFRAEVAVGLAGARLAVVCEDFRAAVVLELREVRARAALVTLRAEPDRLRTTLVAARRRVEADDFVGILPPHRR